MEYFTALEELNAFSNQLTSLDVANNTKLTSLYCYNNQLTSLDVSKNKALTILNCSDNKLTSIDVSNHTELVFFRCDNNQLTSLDVSKNTALEKLYCSDNQLTSLDLSQNTNLNNVDCSFNSYSIDLVGGTFDLTALPEGYDATKASGWLNATVEGNILTVADPTVNVTYVYDLGNGSTEIFTLTPVSCTLTEDMIQPIADRNYGGGYALEPELEILCGDYSLVADTDYTVVYENNVDVGTASVTITGIGMFNGEVTTTFDILTKDISGAVIELGDTLSYNGEEQTQTFAVYLDGLLLPAQYYTVSGNIGTNAGTYTLTIGGNGNTVGTVTAEWSIEKAVPDYEIPTDLTATYGDTLADVELPEGFTWQDNLTTSVGIAGENTFMVTFTPEDTNNYEIIENISISIPVDKADPIVTPLLMGTEFFEGDDLPEITVSDDSTLGWIEWAADIEFLEAGENVLEWHYTPEDSDNYNEMTGTMVVEAQTTTTTTTETTTETTSETTTDTTNSETTTDSESETTTTTIPTTEPTPETTTTVPTTEPTPETTTTVPTTEPTPETTTTVPTTEPTPETTTTVPTTEPTPETTIETVESTDSTETTTETTTDPTTTETVTETTEPEASGTETTEPSDDPDLPQTGYSASYDYLMIAAAAVVLLGIVAMVKSRKDEQDV